MIDAQQARVKMPAASRCGPIPSQCQGQTDALHALRRRKSRATLGVFCVDCHCPLHSCHSVRADGRRRLVSPPIPVAAAASVREVPLAPATDARAATEPPAKMLLVVTFVGLRCHGQQPRKTSHEAPRSSASRAPAIPGPPARPRPGKPCTRFQGGNARPRAARPGFSLGAAQHLDPRPRPHRTHWRPGHPGSGAVAPRRGPTSDSPSPPAKISIFAGSDQGAGVVKMNSDPAQEVLPAAGPAAYWRGAGGREGLRAVLEALPREPSPSASRSGGRRVPGFRALPETRPESREGRREAPTSSAVLRKQPAREATFHNNRPRSPFDSGN